MIVKHMFGFITVRIPKWVFEFVPTGRIKVCRLRKRWGYKYRMKLEQAWNVLQPVLADDDEKWHDRNRGK